MKIIATKIEGVFEIVHLVQDDRRGCFMESYYKQSLSEHRLEYIFIQDNHSFSNQKGTIRGLHFQIEPRAQTKLVRCTKGQIIDVAVDVRKGSPTYKKWVAVELSEDNKKEMLIPKGFAHGYVTLCDNTEVQYKVDEYYSPENDRSIRFDDPEFGIDWGIENPILSDKDLQAPLLLESDANFTY